MKRILFLLLAMGLFFALAGSASATTNQSAMLDDPNVKRANQQCLNCHAKENSGIVGHWEDSAHDDANVGCFSCHASDSSDPYSYNHEGATIRTVLSPKDCEFCHQQEVKEMDESHHATAGQIMASLDNVLAEVVGSTPERKSSAVNGCWQCHGSVVTLKKVDGESIFNENGAPVMDPMTWPNSGIGRINHDGTKGSCNGCHSRHDFSSSRARQPENCGKCHLGPDHPQKEVYEESKHGIAYFAAEKGEDGMNIHKKGNWILGKDYTDAPTCSTCHMGAYQKGNGSIVQGTHNVGDRISWTLRPPISVKLNRVKTESGIVQDVPGDIPPSVGDKVKVKVYEREGDQLVKKMTEGVVAEVMSWEDRRDNMKGVCNTCHSDHHVDNFYEQFDSLVLDYNEKFAEPGQSIVSAMKADGIWSNTDKLGYVWWELWHHEGRRARHGAAMQGPDYTWWHGMYEVSMHFYLKFIPYVLEKAEKHGLKDKYQKMLDEILSRPEHQWYNEGISEEAKKAIEAENKERYNQ